MDELIKFDPISVFTLRRQELLSGNTAQGPNKTSLFLSAVTQRFLISFSRGFSAERSVLWPGFGVVGARGRRGLDGGGQGAEEAGDEGEAQAPPGTEHGPAIAVADVVRETEQVAGVARELKVDAGHAGAQRDDAECA